MGKGNCIEAEQEGEDMYKRGEWEWEDIILGRTGTGRHNRQNGNGKTCVREAEWE